MNRPDVCRTGDFRERGIWGLDGYQAEYVVDSEQYVVALPSGLEAEGVLTEPLSIAEKALDEAARIQSARLPHGNTGPWRFAGRHCLVVGLGPIGLLTAMLLRLRGADVVGLDIVDPASARLRWLGEIGGRYVDGRGTPPARLRDIVRPMDLITEASGVPEMAVALPHVLAPSGICILTGIPPGQAETRLRADILRRLVLNNQVIIGSVNAAPDHFRTAVADLRQAQRRWGDHVTRLITHRSSFTEFSTLLREHSPDEIKAVLEWASTTMREEE
jgi:threonine dehydrogenase-like Zn-dependent dehydrogenase